MTTLEEAQPANKSQPVIHRGPWVVAAGTAPAGPASMQSVIADGAVAVANGLIKAVGKSREIIREFGSWPIREHEGRVLAPALINGHCHLELSYLKLAEQAGDTSSFADNPTAWIRHLVSARDNFTGKNSNTEKYIADQARQTLQHLADEGVAFVGDIGNSLASRLIGQDHGTQVHFLLEFLGLSSESEARALARLGTILNDPALTVDCTAHAPYSTGPVLLQEIKKQADRRRQIFSLHVAESRQEVEFLQTGSGPFKDFLQERGSWDNTFTVPEKSAVHYLESLGVLDEKTLCVHAVHVDRKEIEILAGRRAKVCLCPGSNRFLGVGKPPVTEFLAHGIVPALGTDSKASNRVLSIWREMCLLREDHPDLAPGAVFSMATLAGAEAWGIAAMLGTLAPGKQARILAITDNGSISSGAEVLEYLTSAGESVLVDRVS